jgi:hypothetical protein
MRAWDCGRSSQPGRALKVLEIWGRARRDSLWRSVGPAAFSLRWGLLRGLATASSWSVVCSAHPRLFPRRRRGVVGAYKKKVRNVCLVDKQAGKRFLSRICHSAVQWPSFRLVSPLLKLYGIIPFFQAAWRYNTLSVY